ncbi:MAG TPA: metallophosphoesterase [Acidimicrobiia bacterium]|nr:metallophosphoesterase [Acidimicrobiia bacterium]
MRRAIGWVLVGLLGAIAGLFALSFNTDARGRVGPGQVEVRARLGTARTELRLPPLGQISAATHSAPVTLEAEVDEVDVDRLQALLGAEAPEDLLRREVADDLEPLLRSFAVRALVAAAIAGALAGALVPRRRWPHALVGMVGGVAAVGLLLGLAWRGYDAEVFAEHARFEGPIERAPTVLATVRRHVEGYEDVRRRVEVLGDQVAELYAAASRDQDRTPADDEVRILHVTDIHSNPLGLEVTRRLAEQFRVDAVLDTGDLTSFGLPVESRLGELVKEISVPYLFVPGNHDSFENRGTLGQVENLHLLDGEVVDIRGVRILGIADPVFTASNEVDSAEATARKRALAPDVITSVEVNDPDLLAVHDPVLAEGALGRVPVVVAGHIHRTSQVRKAGTLVLTVGSTGATGLGTFLVETNRSYEAQILRFVGGRLVSVDRVGLSGVGGAFEVERQLVPPTAVGPGVEPEVAGNLP